MLLCSLHGSQTQNGRLQMSRGVKPIESKPFRQSEESKAQRDWKAGARLSWGWCGQGWHKGRAPSKESGEKSVTLCVTREHAAWLCEAGL